MTFDPKKYAQQGSGFDPRSYARGSIPTEVKDEYPNFVDWADRAAVKNFASHNTDGAVEYLKSKYPNADFVNRNGEIVARERGGEWFKLDPSFVSSIFNPKEWVRDATDIASDVIGGIAEGAATVAGAAVGTGVAPGPGTMAGASGANALASATTEGLKQAAGSALGIPDNIDPKSMAIAGATGLVSPFIFGAGKVPVSKLSQAAKDKMAEAGMELSQAGVDRLTRGAPGRIWDRVKGSALPAFAGATSGVDSQYWKAYAKHFDEVNNMIENPSLAAQFSESERMQFKKSLENRKRQLRTEIVDSLKGKEIDIGEAKASYLGEIQRLRQPVNSHGGVSRADAALADVLEQEYQNIFGIKYADDVRNIGHTTFTFKEQPPVKTQTSVEYEMPPRAGDTYGSPPIVDKKTAYGTKTEFPDPKMEVATVMSTTKTNPSDGYFDPILLRWVKAPTEIPNTVPGEDAFRLQARLREAANYDGAYKGGAQRVARGSNEKLRQSMETATGGRSQDGKDAFSQLMYAEEDLLRNMQDNPLAFYSEMSKIPKKANIIKNEGLSILGMPMIETREKLAAHKMFADPATNPISSQGVTATARGDVAGSIGSGVGASVGGPTGAVVGNATARGLISPKAYVGLMKANKRFEDLFRFSPLDQAYNPTGNMLIRDEFRSWDFAD